MKRKKLALPLLALLAAALLLAIWALNKEPVEPSPDETIYSVNYQRADFESVTIEHSNGGLSFSISDETPYGYYCEEIDGLPVLKANFVSIVDDVVSLAATQKIENADLSKYGLASPRVTAHVRLKDGTQYDILVGDDTSNSENLCYYMISTQPDTVYICRRSKFMNFEKTNLYFVDTLLAPLAAPDERNYNYESDVPDRLTVNTEDGTVYSITRYETVYTDGAGQNYRYKQTLPVEGNITGTLGQKYFARVMEFTASSAVVKNPTQEELKAYGFDKPLYTVIIGVEDRESVIKLVPGPGTNFYAYKEGVNAIWIVADYLVSWNELTPRAMLGEYFLSPSMDEVSKVDIECYTEKFSFDIKDGQGYIKGEKLDDKLFSSLYALSCSVRSAVPTDKSGKGSVAKITFTYTDGTTRKVELTDIGSRNLEIVLGGEPMGYLIREAYAETLLAACRSIVKGESFSTDW